MTAKQCNNASKSIITFLVGIFILFSAGLSAYLKPHIAPDENEHFRIIQSMKQESISAFFLIDKEEFKSFGPLSTKPPLFYYLGSQWLKTNIFEINELIYLRIFNLILSILSLYFIFRFSTYTTSSLAATALILVLYSCTIMVPFIGSTVNYDNLANLSAIASLYYIYRFYNERSLLTLLVGITWLLVGTLSKVTNVPFFVGCTIALLFFAYKNNITPKKLIINNTRTLNIVFNTFILIMLIVLNSKVYIGNIIQYGTPLPRCVHVWGEQKCLETSAEIKRDKDLIEEYKNVPRMNFPVFVYEFIKLGKERLYGVFAHKQYPASSNYIVFLNILFLFAGIFFIKNQIFKSWQSVSNLIILSIYLGFLIVQNYLYYLDLGVFGVALQGRYWLPAYPCFLSLIASSLWSSQWLQNKWRYFICVLSLICFSYTYIYFFTKTGDW